jgi:hypothetical protein
LVAAHFKIPLNEIMRSYAAVLVVGLPLIPANAIKSATLVPSTIVADLRRARAPGDPLRF